MSSMKLIDIVRIYPSERVPRGRIEAMEGPLWFMHPLDIEAWDANRKSHDIQEDAS